MTNWRLSSLKNMRLSNLQKYILLKCLDLRGRLERKVFRKFYDQQENKPSDRYQENIVTKSLERLIDKDLLVGFGKRTAKKWFITHVKLTGRGLRLAKELLKERQEKLPLK